jgi:hypothetical protein
MRSSEAAPPEGPSEEIQSKAAVLGEAAFCWKIQREEFQKQQSTLSSLRDFYKCTLRSKSTAVSKNSRAARKKCEGGDLFTVRLGGIESRF